MAYYLPAGLRTKVIAPRSVAALDSALADAASVWVVDAYSTTAKNGAAKLARLKQWGSEGVSVNMHRAADDEPEPLLGRTRSGLAARPRQDRRGPKDRIHTRVASHYGDRARGLQWLWFWTVVGLALRLWTLGSRSLWLDRFSRQSGLISRSGSSCPVEIRRRKGPSSRFGSSSGG